MINRQKMNGFTLIEVLIAVVLIGLIAAIALPTYSAQVIKGARSDAQGTLMGFAQAMEKHFTLNYTYLGAGASGADTGAPAGTVFRSTSPLEGLTRYNLTIQAASASTYTVRATPTGKQVGDGILEVNHLGQRFWDTNNDGDTADSGENNWVK